MSSSNASIYSYKNSFQDKNEEITHDYLFKSHSEQVVYKKISYYNADSYDKIIACSTNDPFINIRNDIITIPSKKSKHIRIKFIMPKNLGTYKGYIYIENKLDDKSILEEILRFVIEIN